MRPKDMRTTTSSRRGLLFLALLTCCTVGPPAHARSKDAAEPDPIGSYPLDAIARQVPRRQKLPCESGELDTVAYRGEHIRYRRPIRVHPAFTERLERFEQVAVQVATEVYGRAPRRLVHMGGLNCRRMRRYPDWMSEHALGNGIDVAGFDFGPLPRGTVAPEGLPKRLRRGFRVRLDEHWGGKRQRDALHSTFLRTLARRLVVRPDIFRVLLGPAWPGHHNHFHFDCAPYRVVEIFESEP